MISLSEEPAAAIADAPPVRSECDETWACGKPSDRAVFFRARLNFMIEGHLVPADQEKSGASSGV